MEIIRERKQVISEYWERRFDWRNNPGSGFSFDCDEQGNLVGKIHPVGLENYHKCTNGTYDVVDKGVAYFQHISYVPAAIRCQCGNEVELDDAFLCTCARCGRDYNGSGQLLAPRSQWGEETGESLADILSVYDPEEIN